MIQYAATQFEQIEQKCNQLLLDGRPEPIDGESSPNWRLPSALAPTFRDIVLFLLCIYLAVTDPRVNSMSVHHIRDKVLVDLAESESALLRLSEHAEIELDQIGHESIRTADTILAILVENAMSFSTKEELDKKGRARLPFFDLVHIYSSYTSNCVRIASPRRKPVLTAHLFRSSARGGPLALGYMRTCDSSERKLRP